MPEIDTTVGPLGYYHYDYYKNYVIYIMLIIVLQGKLSMARSPPEENLLPLFSK